MNSIVSEGKRQRFCQQCGRFHDLCSFDGDKRSCRARLQRHNARRRKKADTMESSRSAGTARLRGGYAAKKGAREDETVDYARPASSRQKQAHGTCVKVPAWCRLLGAVCSSSSGSVTCHEALAVVPSAVLRVLLFDIK